ncbi:MAG: NAD-dependent epimerase/dehydratase family protein [Pirellulaceae bacterium]
MANKTTRRRCLITGGAGFVGFHLAQNLLADEATDVALADNFVRGRQDEDFDRLRADSRVRIITGDICEPSFYSQLAGQAFDEVYHLAAIIGVKNVLERPRDVIRVNGMGTLALLDWFVESDSGKLLFSSTSEAYAWTRSFYDLPIPTPEDVPLALTDLKNPRASYAGSKIFGELAVNHYCQQFDKPFAIVRYHNVYGPRMGFEHVIPELFQRSLSGEDPLVVFSPHHQRAFCYVDDAIRATVAAMRDPRGDNLTINVGNDEEEIEIGDLARRILARVRPGGTIEPREAANDPISRRCPDISLARERLDFQPQVSLDDGLDRTLAWYGHCLKTKAA